MSTTALIESLLGGDRWAAERLADLTPAECSLYGFILRRFAQERPPSPPELASRGGTDGALRALVERDLVGLGDAGEVAVAYPFSARPTRHHVRIHDGRSYWAMCAIDALGIPFLTHQGAVIEAREPATDRPISVELDLDATGLRSTPAEAVVVAARSGSGCASRCTCPHINLFASPAAAERYLAQPELHGAILTVTEAAAAGRRLFGGLLERLGAPAR